MWYTFFGLVGLATLILYNILLIYQSKRKVATEAATQYYEEKHFVLTKQKRKLIHFHRWTNWSELVDTPSPHVYQFRYCLDCNKINSKRFDWAANVRLASWNHKPNAHQELHNR